MIRRGLLGALSWFASTGTLACDVEPFQQARADVAGALACTSGECDPLCVDVGRYKATEAIVTDTRTGLVWQRRVDVRLPQPEAARACEGLVLDGTGGFRLPTPPELAGIRYKPGGLFGGGHPYCIPCIDQSAFPDTPADLFWTSRTEPDGTGWYVGFDDGRSHRDVQSDALWVRCVRDPAP
jgi:Protein of unknown function (DUF1566)